MLQRHIGQFLPAILRIFYFSQETNSRCTLLLTPFGKNKALQLITVSLRSLLVLLFTVSGNQYLVVSLHGALGIFCEKYGGGGGGVQRRINSVFVAPSSCDAFASRPKMHRG